MRKAHKFSKKIGAGFFEIEIDPSKSSIKSWLLMIILLPLILPLLVVLVALSGIVGMFHGIAKVWHGKVEIGELLFNKPKLVKAISKVAIWGCILAILYMGWHLWLLAGW